MIIRGRLVEYEPNSDAIAAQMTAELARRLREKLPALSAFAAQTAAELAFGVLDNELEDAASYRWLRTEICKTMADPDHWDGDEGEESVLIRYVQHLAAASHGDCGTCGRRIVASEMFDAVDNVGNSVWSGSPDTSVVYCQECA